MSTRDRFATPSHLREGLRQIAGLQRRLRELYVRFRLDPIEVLYLPTYPATRFETGVLCVDVSSSHFLTHIQSVRVHVFDPSVVPDLYMLANEDPQYF